MHMLIAIRGTRHSQTTLQLSAYLLEACRRCEPPTVMTVVDREVEHGDAKVMLARAVEPLVLSGAEIRTQVAEGLPAREILRQASADDYDLLVVGECPPDYLPGRLSRRSTTWRVVEGAPCSVLIAKGRISPIRRILVCDSGAHDSPALSYLCARLADALGGEEEVTVLHVASKTSAGPRVEGYRPKADVDEPTAEDAPEGALLLRDCAALDLPGLRARALVRHGAVVDEILTEARSGVYDLVIIGAHRKQGWQRLALEDLAFKIAAGLDRPVLVARLPVAGPIS